MNHVTPPCAWPLLFTYRGPVFGNGFLSYVELCGRLLAMPEAEGVWLNGINPGAFAVGATTLEEANKGVREALTKVFIDFAESSESFAAFRSTVEAFYRECDHESAMEWEQALKAVQDGQIPVPDGLARKPAGWECFVRVTEKRVEELTPHDNPPVVRDAYQLAAAA